MRPATLKTVCPIVPISTSKTFSTPESSSVRSASSGKVTRRSQKRHDIVFVPKNRNDAVTSRFPRSLDSADRIGRVNAPPKIETTILDFMIPIRFACVVL